MDDTNRQELISQAELDELARLEPELARQLLKALLRIRAGGEEAAIDLRATSRWSPLKTLADAYRERPPTPYLVERLLPLPSLSLFYGPPGTMKSLALMDLAICVASGQPWLGPGGGEAFATQAAPLLWLDLDQGDATMSERLAAIGRGHGIPEQASFYWKSLPQQGLNLEDPAVVEELAALVRCLGARLVCIDNLGVAKGAADENTDRMIPVMYHLRQLAEQSGSAVVVLHHARKETGTKARFGEGSRGHTSIMAAVDLSLGFDRDEQEPVIRLKVGKARHRPLAPFLIQFQVEHRPGTDELGRAWFEGIANLDSRPAASSFRPASQVIDDQLLSILERGPQNQRSLLSLAAVELPESSERLILRRLQRLLSQGAIYAQRGQRNALIYLLPAHAGRLEPPET